VTDPCPHCAGKCGHANVLDEAHDFRIVRGFVRCEACEGTGRGDVQRRREADLEREMAEVFGVTGG
jgi:hypothetical protein